MSIRLENSVWLINCRGVARNMVGRGSRWQGGQPWLEASYFWAGLVACGHVSLHLLMQLLSCTQFHPITAQ